MLYNVLFTIMDIKYRIRKRTANGKEQYFVDYKRFNNGDEEPQWMGGFYSETEDGAKDIIAKHRQYEELRKRLQMTEDIIYDETEEKHD